MNIEIRKEKENEYFETEAVVKRAFYNKFEQGCNEHLMVHVLRDHPVCLKDFCRVAVVDGHVAGVIMYFKAKVATEDGEIEVASFGPLCVDHKYKNHGIGGKLLEETIPLVKKAGYPGILIMGEPEYYPKHGFNRAGSFGLTDAEGNVYDAFMGIELKPGALHIPGGRFIEPEEICEFPDEEVAAFDSKFDYLNKAIRPLQWTYPNANNEENGYHLEFAMQHPREFETLFAEYVNELSEDDPLLKEYSIKEFTDEIWEDVNATGYVIIVDGQPAGLFVSSVPSEKLDKGNCQSYLQELYVKPEYRGRGIGKDIFLRFIKAQTDDTGFCMIEESKAGKYWTRLLKENGYEFKNSPEDHVRVFCHVKV